MQADKTLFCGVRRMVLDMTFFLFAIPAVIFAGISKGGFGSGAAFASTPFLALILDPGDAIGLMLPLLMLMDVTALRPYWRKWDKDASWTIILWAVPGVLLAALIYRYTDADLFRLLIGIISIGFVIYQMARGSLTPVARSLPRWSGRLAGAAVGFTSFVSHAGGPPAAVYLLSRGLDKGTYQATTVIIFWAVNAMKFIPYAVLGIFSAQSFLANLYLAPVAVLGIWMGVKFHHLVPERLFFGLTYVFLLITGGKLIWDALT